MKKYLRQFMTRDVTLPRAASLFDLQIGRPLTLILLGAVLLFCSMRARAEIPIECEVRGGDRTCKEAKLVGSGFRPFGPSVNPEKWFPTIDAGLADSFAVIKPCRWQEVRRFEDGLAQDSDLSEVPVTMVVVEMWSADKCEKMEGQFGFTFFPDKLRTCDTGYSLQTFGNEKFCMGPRLADGDRQKGQPKVCEGNPCNVATGNKFQRQTDYAASNAGGLEFTRSYNSYGGTWRNTYDRSIARQVVSILGANARVTATRPDGKIVRFLEISDGSYIASRDVNDTLFALKDANKNIIGWQLRTESDSIESYSADGRLQTITSRTGLSQALTYEAVAGKNVLKSVKDAFGRLLVFKNDASGRMQTMTDPSGNIFTYGYDTNGRLATVTYPGTKIRTYHYNEPAMTGGSNLPYALTGITDENNIRYAIWKYNAAGNVVLSEHAGGAERVSLQYLIDNDEARRTIVTDAAGNSRTYNLILVGGIFMVSGMNEACDTCLDDALSREYDDNGNLVYRVDRNGEQTSWTYDMERNLELTRLENSGKLTTTEWHPKFRLPTKILTADLETVFEYDPTFGTLLRKIVTDINNQISRTWTYAYFDGTRLLKKIDGPRTDVKDETTFEYDAQGNLAFATNAVGHKTIFTLYDKNGRVGSITDPNGLVTLVTYDERGNTKTRKTGQELTTFEYDNVGQLTNVKLPSSDVITYSYDGAHRLTDVKNSAGERQHFTLDAFGNQRKVEYFDALGNVTFSNTAEFDRYNRLHKSIASAGHVTTFDVDENGDVRSVTDALLRETRFRRENGLLQEVTFPDQSSTQYGYDGLDQLQVVTNAKNVPTIYSSNAFGDQVDVDTRDPDAFVRKRLFDGAGNLKTKIDFRGILTSFTYDELNRIKTISAPNVAGITYSYDIGANAKGRLTSISDESGVTTRTYNAQGRIETVARAFGGVAIKVRYGYDAAGRRVTVTYPSGRVVTYKYDKEQVVGVDVGSVALISQAKYTPFGQARSWRWGNGLEYSRHTDLDGRIDRYSLGGSDRTIKFDEVGNVKEILDSNDPGQNQKFGYDELDRVTDYFIGPNFDLQEHYEYDLAGNRTSATIKGKTYPYTYLDGTDSLSVVAGPTVEKWQGSSAGSILSDGRRTFKVDAYRSLASVTVANVKTDYLRNGFRQRVTKRYQDGSSTHFVFDESGLLLAELDKAGTTLVEHIWLDDQPIAVVVNGVANYVFADHLNTPRMITDPSNRVRWKWHSNPFGGGEPNSNPSGIGSFIYGQRFPGQYYDVESGLHHNNFRDYDPLTGRYILSDPIGIDGGLNTYAYALNNPLRFVDFFGLSSTCVAACKAVGGAVGGALGYYTGGAAGAAAGGTGGAAAGSVVPVVGTAVGGSAGAASGALIGSRAGTVAGIFVGTSIGGAVSSLICSSSDETKTEVPSNVGPGPNAGDSVAAGPSPRPTKEQQDKINEIGDRDGCHTCGTKDSGTKSGDWIGDHQDPTKLNPEGKAQRYYPHCKHCSNVQGGRIRWLPGPK